MSVVLKSVHMRRTTSKSNINCSVSTCKAVNKKNPELSFHKFPHVGQKVIQTNAHGEKSELDRRKLWESNLKMEKAVTPYMHVCSRHFTNEDYITPDEDCYFRRYLKKTAIPTQNLPERKNSCKKSRKVSEKRCKRFYSKRKLRDETLSEDCFHVTEEEDLTKNDCIEKNEAAEALLHLKQSSFKVKEEFLNASSSNTFKQFQDCSTQTEESFLFDRLKIDSDVGVQVNTSCFSIADLITTDKSLNILTGISTCSVLFLLVNLFSKFKTGTRFRRFSVRDRILLVFLKLKLDLTYSALGLLFGDIGVKTVKRLFCETVEVLSDIMKAFIYLPSKDNILMNMPLCFQKYENVRIVLDCTEIQVQTPLCCRINCCKKHHTSKFMTGVTPAGFISYVSPSYEGKTSDKCIFEKSKLVEQLEPYVDQIMVDEGFLIEEICEDYGIILVRPNRNIVSARVHIERAKAKIKIFRIFKNTFPLHLLSIVDDIFIIICAIVNLSKPIVEIKRLN